MKTQKNRKASSFWSLDEHGSLVFSGQKERILVKHIPDSFLHTEHFAVLVMLLCGLLDFTMFNQLFSAIQYDNLFFRSAATIVLLIGFDFGPIYLGRLARRHQQGYNEALMIPYLLLAAFAIAFAASFYLRIVSRDVVLPASAMASNSESNPLALPWALFCCIAPVVTSFVSFGISFSTYNPLEKEAKKLQTSIADIERELIQTHSILAEYDNDAYRFERLSAEDDERYHQSVLLAKEQGILMCDYVRERLKEYLGEPSSANELSKGACQKVMEELAKTTERIRAMPIDSPSDQQPQIPERALNVVS